ncbi:MAG: hypothetical protein HPY85_02920 [Anaerolineae bacterium]|nr:hypothetical protein [Anaerolineae bacterium]
MYAFITQLSALLLAPAGTMAFYIVVVFACTFTLQTILSNRESMSPQIRTRYGFANGIVLLALLALFTLSLMSWQELVHGPAVLPIVEWLSYAVIAIAFSWILSTPVRHQVWDAIFGALGAATAAAFWLISQNWWSGTHNQAFPVSASGWYAAIAVLVLLSTGVLVMVVRRPSGWLKSLLALLVPTITLSLHIYLNQQQNDGTALVRLGFLFLLAMMPQMTAVMITTTGKKGESPAGNAAITALNRQLKSLSESNSQIFQQTIPHILIELADAKYCYLVKSCSHSPAVVIEGIPAGPQRTEPVEAIPVVECEPETIPFLSHALEAQFIMTYDSVPGFRDEFRTLGRRLNLFGVPDILVLPFPLQPETRTSLILTARTKGQWDDVNRAALASSVNSLLLLLHQKQREEQLQKTIQRMLESKQPDFRSIASFNFQDLQENFNRLSNEHENLKERAKELQNDLVRMTDQIVSMPVESDGCKRFKETIQILKAWLDHAQTQNSLLHAELEQTIRENQSLQLEIEALHGAQPTPSQLAYLQPQENQPLDEKTHLNETLARAKDLLYRTTEMNAILEQNQVQSVIVLESIQEQIVNLHQFQTPNDDAQDGESFLLQAEYFLEDIRTAQSVLKEQSRLQKMLEESFLNSLKMKDFFDHLAQINQRNYKKINQIFVELEKHRSKSEEASLILSSIQEENEKLRMTMLEALAKNQGDSLTIENLQAEMISTLEEVEYLRDKIEQKQEMIHTIQLEQDMVSEGIRENNQIIISLIQDILQPISTITGCSNLLSAHMDENDSAAQLFEQINASTRTIQDQVNKLISCAERNDEIVKHSPDGSIHKSGSVRPPSPPEALTQHE